MLSCGLAGTQSVAFSLADRRPSVPQPRLAPTKLLDSMSFEVLHLALMPLGRGARLEGAEISAALCFRIEFAGI